MLESTASISKKFRSHLNQMRLLISSLNMSRNIEHSFNSPKLSKEPSKKSSDRILFHVSRRRLTSKQTTTTTTKNSKKKQDLMKKLY